MLFLALRHLASRKRQTALIFLGISLGTMMFTVISGLQLGMREFITDRLLSNTAHIKISAREELVNEQDVTQLFYGESQIVHWITPPFGKREEAHIQFPQGWFDRLRSDPEVLGYSPSLTMSVIINRGNSRYPGSLNGLIPAMQEHVMNTGKFVEQGKLSDLTEGGNKIIVGVGLLEKLGVRVGDTLKLSSGIGELRPFKIVGLIRLGVKPVDDTILLASLKDVQQLNKTPGGINQISVSIADLDRAREFAHLWQLTSRDKVESWDEANANILEVFQFQDIVRIAVTSAILIVAGFGIYNVLSIQISQKKREIAILRSIGYTPKHVIELFLIQGIILGVAGAVIGLLFGHLVNLYLATVDVGIHLGPTGTLIISKAPSIYLTGFLLAFISAILASLLPARAAGRLTPIDIIRSEV